MNPTPWKDVVKALRHSAGQDHRPVAGDFWADFRARARLRRREPAVESEAAPRPAFWWPATAAAAALLLAVGLWGVPRLPVDPGVSHVRSVEVVATHGAVMIMEDESTHGTILWVVDMELDANGGGGT